VYPQFENLRAWLISEVSSSSRLYDTSGLSKAEGNFSRGMDFELTSEKGALVLRGSRYLN
jgi:hypothetical protein